jgi:hypothetical protein
MTQSKGRPHRSYDRSWDEIEQMLEIAEERVLEGSRSQLQGAPRRRQVPEMGARRGRRQPPLGMKAQGPSRG